jgi:hypothetical protein
MSADHVEFWVQKPAAPIEIVDKPTEQLPPAPTQEKVAPDDVLLMGMMIWMQDGILLDWMHQGKEEGDEEEKKRMLQEIKNKMEQ